MQTLKTQNSFIYINVQSDFFLPILFVFLFVFNIYQYMK